MSISHSLLSRLEYDRVASVSKSTNTKTKMTPKCAKKPVFIAQALCATTTNLRDKDEAQVQNVHKRDEMPLLLPSVQDPQNLCHLLKQCRSTP